MKRASFFLFFSVAAIASLTAGCGSADDPPPPSPPASSSTTPTDPSGSGSGSGSGSTSATPATGCTGATQAICEHACACTGNGHCIITYGSGVVTEEHKSLAECTTFYQAFVCGQPDYAKDYTDACHTAVESAACIATGKGSALALPDACQKKK